MLLTLVAVVACAVAATAVTVEPADSALEPAMAGDVSFAALESAASAGGTRAGAYLHAAEHEAVASRVRAAADAFAEESAAAGTDAAAALFSSEQLALDSVLRDPAVPEVDKLVARLQHATRSDAGHFFADRFYLDSLKASRASSPRLVQVLDDLAVGLGDEELVQTDAEAEAHAAAHANAQSDAEAEAEADADAEEATGLNTEEQEQLQALADGRFDLMRFASASAKPRPQAVPSTDHSADASNRPNLAAHGVRPNRHAHKPHARKRKAKAKRKSAAAADIDAQLLAEKAKAAGMARAKLAAAAVAQLAASKFQHLPSAEQFRAMLARRHTPGYDAPDTARCDVEAVLRALDAWHTQPRTPVRHTKPVVGRRSGYGAAQAQEQNGGSAAALEDAALNELIDAVEEWFLKRLPLVDLHIAVHSKAEGCKNLNVQAIALLKLIALKRLGEEHQRPVGTPSGFEEMICRLRGEALWKWFDRRMSRPNGLGEKWLSALEGKLRFGEDHTGPEEPGLTLMYLALQQLGAQHRGKLVVRLLTLPGITYGSVPPARRAVVQKEAERLLVPMFSNLRVSTRFLLHKVYFAILSSQKRLTELLPNLEGVKVGNLRSRTWASVRGVGGATAYISKGKLVVPPLQKGWKQVVIPAVPEQTLDKPPKLPLPEGWLKQPKEGGGFEYYHELYPPLVEFTDGNQTLEGYERPVDCDAPNCAALQMAIFPEENLLNNETLVPPKLLEEVEHGYAQGYSIATHEMAHCVDMNGLHSAQHTLLQDEYERKMAANAIFTDGFRDPKMRLTMGCYASHTVYEYFAQLTNTWLGTNHGLDPHFSLCVGPSRCRRVPPNDIAACASVPGCDSEHFPRANTQQWVAAHESPAILNLMWSLYGRARLVSFPVTLSAGFGYIYSPELARAVKFAGVYLDVCKRTKTLSIYKSQHSLTAAAPAASDKPQKPVLVVPLKGAGISLWSESAGPRTLWRRRPQTDLECLLLTTVRKRHFYLCQRDVEQLLTALNEAIFMA